MSDIDCTLPENMELDECESMHDDDMHMDDDDKMHMKMANGKFLMTAMMSSAMYLLKYFRYRSDAMEYYTAGDQYFGTDAMNYWKMANTLRLPAGGAIFGILMLTQLLSLFGVAGEINIMAWMYLIPVWMIANMVSHAIAFVGYDAAYSWYAEDTTNNAMGASLMSTVGSEIYTMLAKETAIMMGLVFMHKEWLHGQVMMLPEEKQEMFMEKKGKKGGHDDDDEEMEVSLRAFYGF